MCSIRLELRKAKFHHEIMSPHDLTTTTSQRHKLGLSSAEHHNSKQSHTPRKRSVVDKEINSMELRRIFLSSGNLEST